MVKFKRELQKIPNELTKNLLVESESK